MNLRSVSVMRETAQARGLAGRTTPSREAATPRPRNAKPVEAAGLHIPRAGKLYLGGLSFPEIAGAFKREIRATGDVRPGCRFRAGAAAPRRPHAALCSCRF